MSRCFAVLLSLSVVTSTFAGTPVAKNADLRLGDDGAISGQVLTSAGQPQADYELQLRDAKGDVIRVAKTDTQGAFRIQARPGAYQLAMKDQTVPVRVWANQTAPPSAGKGLLITTGNTARGQLFGAGSIGPTVLVVGAITTATVVGIVVANNSGS
ncbi:MAG: carboxypeptidase regulatory-like domain-containing protein [Planctomycetales bacterium]|nr:carboxypeptidase regulatory-like domain-containing protein [Planctomycetales bacterium]